MFWIIFINYCLLCYLVFQVERTKQADQHCFAWIPPPLNKFQDSNLWQLQLPHSLQTNELLPSQCIGIMYLFFYLEITMHFYIIYIWYTYWITECNQIFYYHCFFLTIQFCYLYTSIFLIYCILYSIHFMYMSKFNVTVEKIYWIFWMYLLFISTVFEEIYNKCTVHVMCIFCSKF